jgi:hypothetical protein
MFIYLTTERAFLFFFFLVFYSPHLTMCLYYLYYLSTYGPILLFLPLDFRTNSWYYRAFLNNAIHICNFEAYLHMYIIIFLGLYLETLNMFIYLTSDEVVRDIYIYTYIYIYVYVCIYIHTYIYMFIYIHIDMYIYI